MVQKKVAGRKIEKSVNVALQGGGSHGAFTWGVLDKFFEDDRLWINSISGTSAGAMNAVVASQGMYDGGAEGARSALRAFWKDVSDAGKYSPIKRSPWDMMMGNWSMDNSPGYLMMDLMSRMSSPYDMNFTDFNPLRKLLLNHVDFDKLSGGGDGFTIFISATNVETGRVKIFTRENLTVEAVLASACLPSMFKAVEIDGQHFWDGGYMGNPVLSPFRELSPVDDTLIVQINPIVAKGVPKTAHEIQNRVGEISFNASLMKELRFIREMNTLVENGELDGKKHPLMRMHLVEAQDSLAPLGASSKLNTEWEFLEHLFHIGRDAAGTWLAKNYDSIGKQSTLDLDGLFAEP